MEASNVVNISDSPRYRCEVEEQPEVYSGKTPFAYKQAMSIVREDALKNVSADYIRRCAQQGRINNLDISILQLIYKHKFLNKRMLEIMTGKPEKTLKRIMHKLVGNGFIERYYCTYPQNTGEICQTPYFYAVTKGVFEFFSKTWSNGAYYVPEPLNAVKTLAANQFEVCAREYRPYMTEERMNIEIEVNRYIYRYPYSASFKVEGVPITMIPIVIRREDKDTEIATICVKVMFGLIKKFSEGAVPVLVCEDVQHMAVIRDAIRKDEKIANLRIYYTYDLAIPGGRMFDRIYSNLVDESDKSSFAEITFDFDDIVK